MISTVVPLLRQASDAARHGVISVEKKEALKQMLMSPDPSVVMHAHSFLHSLSSSLASLSSSRPSALPKRSFLSLTVHCSATWEPSHGVRELLQNARDGAAKVAARMGAHELIWKKVLESSMVAKWVCSAVSVRGAEPVAEVRIEQIGPGGVFRLVCVNNHTRLPRTILLMGASDKREQASSSPQGLRFAGKYGDGLKTSIVTFLRYQAQVQFLTNDERWEFLLAVNPEYPEQGPTALAYDTYPLSTAALTTVIVSPLPPSAFDEKNYLFLRQQNNSAAKINASEVRSEVSCDLLLDESERHRVYVNDIFICEDENMFMGMNFRGNVDVGRDRNRVQIRHDMVVSAWKCAIQNEPLVASQLLFELLTQGGESLNYLEQTVKHDVSVCIKVLEIFKSKYGQNAYPILIRDTKGFEIINKLGGIYKPIVCGFRLFSCLAMYDNKKNFNPQNTANEHFSSLLRQPEHVFESAQERDLWKTMCEMLRALLDIPPSRLALRKAPFEAPLTAMYHVPSGLYIVSHHMLDATRVHKLFDITREQCESVEGKCSCVLSCLVDKIQEETKLDPYFRSISEQAQKRKLLFRLLQRQQQWADPSGMNRVAPTAQEAASIRGEESSQMLSAMAASTLGSPDPIPAAFRSSVSSSGGGTGGRGEGERGNVEVTQAMSGGVITQFWQAEEMTRSRAARALLSEPILDDQSASPFTSQHQVRSTIHHECEVMLGANLKLLEIVKVDRDEEDKVAGGDGREGIDIPLWGDPNYVYKSSNSITKQHVQQFASVLSSMAKVFNIKKTGVVNMYIDEKGGEKALNQGHRLFFNLRYFVQCHLVKHETNHSRWTLRALASWFITFCHELAHNEVRAHNREHGHLVEQLMIEHTPAFLQHFRASLNN